jgi:nitrilase
MIIKVCLVQESPVFFDKEQTLLKLESLAKGCAQQGAQLIVFPESFIPGYPRGFSFGATIGKRTDEGRRLYELYHQNSINLETKDKLRLEKLAQDTGAYLIIGATEKTSHNGSLYCSMIYISPTNGLLGVHHKIKPTGTERLIWAEAGGESLITVDATIGKIGGLICWENYMPLARMSMYQQGVQIYVAPTADSRDVWIPTMQHIALEGRCFVLGCNQYFTKSMYPHEFQHLVESEDENFCRGGSVIVSPLGKIIAGPLFDKAGIISAEIDLAEITRSKLDFDVNGHYNRADIFEFKVRNQPNMIKDHDDD